jgi:hypothetical protein
MPFSATTIVAPSPSGVDEQEAKVIKVTGIIAKAPSFNTVVLVQVCRGLLSGLVAELPMCSSFNFMCLILPFFLC